MSDSDRDDHRKAGLIATAIVAAVAVAIYWAMFYDMGFQSGQNERKANVEAEHYASDTANQIERECGAKSGQAARECITKIVATERESQRGESDLAAQWKAANWVMWAGILAGAQLIATALGLYFVKRTLDATLEAVEDAGKATETMRDANLIAKESNRPWIKVTPPPHVIVINEPDCITAIEIPTSVKNFGNSPAIGLTLGAFIVGTEKELNEKFVLDRVGTVAEYAADGVSLYPNETTMLGERTVIGTGILPYPSKAAVTETTPPGHYLALYVVYASVASNRIYHSTSFYFLAHTLPYGRTAFALDQLGREYHGAVVDHHHTNDDNHYRVKA